jgi:hypothetical protein
MSKFLKHVSLLFLTIFAVLAMLVYIQPIIYRLMPSDFDRHLVFERYVEEKPGLTNADVLIFGDSRSMFGIDSRIIKKQLHRKNEIYNFSSVGQNIYESSYFYSKVKPDTKLVIQCAGPSFFSVDIKHNLPEPKAISMYLSGYRIDTDTKKLIPAYNRFFDRWPITNYYNSRSYFVTYLHNLIRPIFDDEVFNEKSRSSRYFPHHYTRNKMSNYSSHVKNNCAGYVFKSEPKSQLKFVSQSLDFFRKRNMRYILVLMPVNPDLCNVGYPDFKKYANELRSINGLDVIDLSNLLTAEFFYDDTHANRMGAQVISNELANQLRYMKF